MEDQLFQNSDLNNDLVICIENNDNQMTFVGAYSLLVSLVASFESAKTQMMLLGPQINYLSSKSHMIVLISVFHFLNDAAPQFL